MSAPGSGCCTGGNPVPALDWLPGVCGILVCVRLAFLACLSLSPSLFPRNKTSSFLQPIKLLVLRKQERRLLMCNRCRTQPFGSARAAKRKPGISGCEKKEKRSRGWGWSGPRSDSATADGLPGSACMWGIRPGTGGAEQPQPGSEIQFMRHFKAFPSYLPATPRRPMAAPPALAEDRSDCYRGAASPRSPRGLTVRAARLWHRAGASRGPAVTLADPSRGCSHRSGAGPAPGRRLRGCGRRRSRPSCGHGGGSPRLHTAASSCSGLDVRAERGRAGQDSATGDGTIAPAPGPGRAGLGGQPERPGPVPGGRAVRGGTPGPARGRHRAPSGRGGSGRR